MRVGQQFKRQDSVATLPSENPSTPPASGVFIQPGVNLAAPTAVAFVIPTLPVLAEAVGGHAHKPPV